MQHFDVATEEIKLPRVATPQARRVAVSWHGRPICAFTQGEQRCYLYPVYSPAGVPLTAESPVDHPHHDSVTVGSDVVITRFPPLTPEISPLDESGTYNLYTNRVFQGRSPGRTWVTNVEAGELASDHLRVVQTVEWQGPEEWGAADRRRVLAIETRTTDIQPGETVNTLDVRSQLRPTDWDLSFGPTRHAYFTIRFAYGLRVVDGGALVDDDGRRGGAAITNQRSAWIDASGEVSHGKTAGLAIVLHASTAHVPWVAYDWGTTVVNPFAREAGSVKQGETLDLGIRLLAHDGDASEAQIASLAAAVTEKRGLGASMPRPSQN